MWVLVVLAETHTWHFPPPEARYASAHQAKSLMQLLFNRVSKKTGRICQILSKVLIQIKENLSSCDQTKKLMISSSTMMSKRVIRFSFWLNCTALEAGEFASCEESRFGLGRE